MIASITSGSERLLLPYSVSLANRLHVDLRFIGSFTQSYYIDEDIVVYASATTKLKDLENFVFEVRDTPNRIHLLVTTDVIPRLRDIRSLDIYQLFPEVLL